MSEFLQLFADLLDDWPQEQREKLARLVSLDADAQEERDRRIAALEQRVVTLERRSRPTSRLIADLATEKETT